MAIVPLEDHYEDILAKSLKGRGLSRQDLAAASGLDASDIAQALSGQVNEGHVHALAESLNLHASALLAIGKGEWAPPEIDARGLLHFNTPYPISGYEEMTVNSYLLFDPETQQALAFDSGAKAQPMLEAIEEHDLSLVAILITHTHGDHVADLETLYEETGKPPIYLHSNETLARARSIEAGWRISCGALEAEARLTPGHSSGGTTFVVHGLKQPVAITGDALFAGSVGGAAGNWERALQAVVDEILTLPDNTIICPGHGPLSTVGEEKAHNPLFPQFK